MPGTALYNAQNQLLATYSSIQDAVNAASNGDTVQLANGIYQEQVTVSNKTITIKGNGSNNTIIEAPNNIQQNTNYRGNQPNTYAVVGAISNGVATGLTIQGLTIDGNNQGDVPVLNGSNLAGIGGTNAVISADGIAIQNIRSSNPTDGNPYNTGVLVDNSDGTTRAFSLTNSSVKTFQRNGLTLNGAGLTVNVSGNTITGSGAIAARVQNGIQVSRGATGTVSNNTLSGLDYIRPSGSTQSSISVLALQAGNGLNVTGNAITGTTDANGQGNLGQVGVEFQDTNGGTVSGNTIRNMQPAIVEDGRGLSYLPANFTLTTPIIQNSNEIVNSGQYNGYNFVVNSQSSVSYNVGGSAASDVFNGGSGNDTFVGFGGGDDFFGGAGNDVFYGNSTGADANTTGVSGSTAEYTGPALDYTVTQNADGSFTVFNKGNEQEGTDTLHGIDTVLFDGGGSINLAAYPPPPPSGGGSSGPSTTPTPGPDNLAGTSGSDTIAGLAGDDTINGLGGNDLLLGNQGNDSITDGDGNSTLVGGMDNDRITVGNGSNLLYGDEGADTISAGNGNNTIIGGTGNSALDANDGADSITAGSGNDLVLGNQGNDTINLGGGIDTALGGMGNDFITATGSSNDLLYGNEGSDTIQAGNGNNTIVGGQDSTDGADFITSGSGNDLILGNGGDDTVAAGGGADTASGGYGNDVILGNQGNDIILGNQGDDTLYGGQGADTLVGGMGNDVLYGNEGDDVLYGNEGLNTFVFNPGDTDFRSGVGTGDTVMDFATGTSRIDFASGPAGSASNFGATSTTATDFASIQAAAQTLINGGDAYAFVSDGVDGFLFTTGGTGTAITDAVKLAGAASAGAVKYTDIAHGALA